ncbi:MAG: 50S ribosomal protein L4, partial [Cyanobacteria bacterium J06598_3]
PRDYTTKMNRKERRLALRTAFQGCAESIVVVKDFSSELTEPKTKEVVAAIDRWGVDTAAKILLITVEKGDNLDRSVRNIANVKHICATNLNIYDILHADAIVVTASALEKIQEVYGE